MVVNKSTFVQKKFNDFFLSCVAFHFGGHDEQTPGLMLLL
jgi:hypothetical protein